METKGKTYQELQAEIDELTQQLTEAHDTIEAIRTGQIDALVVHDGDSHQLFTLKTADSAYRVFFEKMTEGAVTIGQDGTIIYCNSQFATMVHVPLTSLIGVSFANFFTPECQPAFQHLFQKCWEEDCKGELTIQGGSDKVPVQLSLTALELEGGLSLSIILTDLTKQKQTQQELEEKNQQLININHALEVSNHDLQQFASIASHDLQEPLRKIQMFSGLLKENKNGPSESSRYLDKIISSSKRMKILIIDILNYSKLSASTNTFSAININDLLAEIMDDFELLIQEKHAVIHAAPFPVITGNRGQIRQVFQNIISNALKFSKPEQFPVIDITCRRLKEKSFDSEEQNDGPYCSFYIQDNGIGFDEKYSNNIFSLFERLHSKDIYEGTGIGLAITKKIVEKHNGLITARSHEGKGAVFIIILPVHP
jgi:PAS domain S-box-containing protein